MSKLLACLSALAAILIFSLSANLLPGSMERLALEFDVAFGSLGRIFSVQFGAYFLTTLWAGILADRYGMRPPLVGAAVLTTAGAWIWAITPSIPVAYAGAVLMGMGGGISESMASALLSKLYPTRRKFMLNLSQIVYCVGAISGPALLGYYLPRGISWRLFYGILAVMAIALLVLLLLSRMPPAEHEDRVDVRKLVTVARRPGVIIPCLAIFGYVFSETCVISFCNTYLYQHRGAPESWAIWSISIVWAAMAVGRALCAVIPESISFEKLIAWLMVATAISMGAQLFIGTWQSAIVLFGISGLTFAGTWPLIVGLAATRNPRFTSSVLGIVIATGALGCVFAPQAVTLLLAVVPVRWIFPICAIPLLVCALLVFRLMAIPHDELPRA